MAAKTTKVKDLFAFWRYDLFPYVLGGTVVEMSDKGNIRTREYDYMWFTPIKIMPLDAGKALWSRIDKVRNEHHVALREFDKEWRSKIEQLLPDVVRQ